MRAHRTDIVSFAFGLVFLGLALWWLLARILGLAVPPVGWFLAGGLVVIGLLGLVGALSSVRRQGQAGQPGQPEATVAAPWRDGSPRGAVAAPTGADEWPVAAVEDVPVPAREDPPADGEPRWSPAGDPSVREPGDFSAQVTRELPPLDPEAGEPPTGRRTAGEPPA
ncbi:hypothetical protein AB0H28_01135 [Micromonospora sp. NPDC050980]|uniref:hypothetical protein n=1 Tax=Micromonospora sp. NPDC050980 TaxID=3155161 RepID=UPI0033E60802